MTYTTIVPLSTGQQLAKEMLEDFLFNVALYADFQTDKNFTLWILGVSGTERVDGHCPYCSGNSTFVIKSDLHHSSRMNIMAGKIEAKIPNNVKITCARNATHEPAFHVRALPLVRCSLSKSARASLMAFAAAFTSTFMACWPSGERDA